jgi:hypothetical protein
VGCSNGTTTICEVENEKLILMMVRLGQTPLTCLIVTTSLRSSGRFSASPQAAWRSEHKLASPAMMSPASMSSQQELPCSLERHVNSTLHTSSCIVTRRHLTPTACTTLLPLQLLEQRSLPVKDTWWGLHSPAFDAAAAIPKI